MLQFKNRGCLIESLSELPTMPTQIRRGYMDFETTSGNKKIAATNPHHHCKPIGLAITWDKEPTAYFIPHRLLLLNDAALMKMIVSRTITWVNQNVKYDMHVMANAYDDDSHWVLAELERMQLCCTLTLAKMIDSERQYKGGYGLDALSKAWLGEDIAKYEEAMKPYLVKNKDYGEIPIELLAEYACQDVITNRKLDHYIIATMPQECYRVKDIEKETTKTLFAIERNGFYCDPRKVANAGADAMGTLIEIGKKLEAKYERPIFPHIPKDVETVLCGVYQMPVLKKTDAGKASFDKKTMRKYLALPDAPREFIEDCLRYRQFITFIGGFIKPVLTYQINGVTHCNHNQMIRTGRVSCTMPNLQAMSLLAKALIEPRAGNGFIVFDYSQIELRLMAHFSKAKSIIRAYNDDPDIDFHSWTSKEVDISRKMAKTLNFSIGVGQGEKATAETISSDPDVQKIVKADMDRLGGTFEYHLMEYVRSLRSKYNDKYPTFRPTIRNLAKQTQYSGFTETAYGRRRHLVDMSRGIDGSHKGFSTLCQGTAADLMKERMNALRKSLPPGVFPIAVVHDEAVLEGPIEEIERPELHHHIAKVMESPMIPFSLPIRISLNTSRKNWLEAKDDSKPVMWR